MLLTLLLLLLLLFKKVVESVKILTYNPG